jgi:hypothetical protein
MKPASNRLKCPRRRFQLPCHVWQGENRSYPIAVCGGSNLVRGRTLKNQPENRDMNEALHLESHLPASGDARFVGVIDLDAEQPADSSGRRKGHLRLKIPALPNHTNPEGSISFILMESVNRGREMKPTVPKIELEIKCVANTGSPAPSNAQNGEPWVEMPTPLGLGGIIGLLLVVRPGVGDCTHALVEADWVND